MKRSPYKKDITELFCLSMLLQDYRRLSREALASSLEKKNYPLLSKEFTEIYNELKDRVLL
ncbi:MAG: hypothetical protein AB8V19_02715 [Candidatus Midichloria sp.]